MKHTYETFALLLSNCTFSGFSRRRQTLFALPLLVMLLSVTGLPATFTVTKTADTNDGVCDADCSFREAVAAANAAAGNDSIVFDGTVFGTAQTITLTGGTINITGNQTLSITGADPSLLFIDGSTNGVLSVLAGATATISNLTVTGSLAGNTGRVFNNGTMTLNNVVVTHSSNNIGIHAVHNFGNLTITNSSIIDNPKTGVFNEAGTLNISGSVFANNAAGIFNNRGTANVTDTSIRGSMGSSGFENQEGMATLDHVLIENNTRDFEGAGLRNTTAGTIPAVMTVINSRITNNQATGGRGHGGGVANIGGTLTLTRSLVDNNTGNTNGGGLYSTGTTNVFNSTISGNLAVQIGGGIWVNGGTTTLTNATIAWNTANAAGGGGGVARDSGTVNARSTIIGSNLATTSTSQDLLGSLGSQGYNLIGNTTGSTITGNTTGNILNRAPMLGPLRDNGGLQSTVAPYALSPAVDGGDPNDFFPTDQRGIARSQDGDLNGSALPDIGAYERKVTTFTVTKAEDTADQVCDGDCSLREAVQGANLSDDPDVAVVFSPFFNVPRTIVVTLGILPFGRIGTFFINGPGPGLLTISGANASRVLYVDVTSNLTLSGVTISGGNGAGPDEPNGGGIRSLNGSTLIVNNSVIANNRAGTVGSTNGVGGGISITNGTLFIINSSVRNNSTAANSGGGIYQLGGSTTIIASDIRSNQAGGTGDGGGIATLNGGTLSVSNSTFDGNTARNGGGIVSTGPFTMTYSTVSNNASRDRAGGIDLVNSAAALTNSTISGNSATLTGGGGIANSGSTLLATNITIAFNNADSDNNGSGSGGGILGGTTSARNVIIARNQAATAPDVSGTVASQGFNLIQITNGTTITGTLTGNIHGQDPLLMPLRLYGGTTASHALKSDSPAVDKGSAAAPPVTTDQRGLARPFDFPSIPNPAGGNGSDIGAFERQLTESSGALPFDFDGDGKTDIAIFRPSVAEWWINRSGTGVTWAAQFGAATDSIVPGDFTGDGKADAAIWRPSTGEWFVLRSEDSSYFSFPFGTNGDVPLAGDFDGDGKSDATIYRPSTFTWFIRRSSDGGITIQQFGAAGDVPVASDYDGDGKTDIAIFRPSVGQWWMNRSTAGVLAVTFGNSSDKLVPGDYTGDGKSDNALFRPSTGEWFILRSDDFSFYSFPFGTNGDTPAPGDYDGDGKFDATVFRSSNTTWYSQRTTAGTLIQQFGSAGDRPVPNAFVP